MEGEKEMPVEFLPFLPVLEEWLMSSIFRLALAHSHKPASAGSYHIDDFRPPAPTWAWNTSKEKVAMAKFEEMVHPSYSTFWPKQRARESRSLTSENESRWEWEFNLPHRHLKCKFFLNFTFKGKSIYNGFFVAWKIGEQKFQSRVRARWELISERQTSSIVTNRQRTAAAPGTHTQRERAHIGSIFSASHTPDKIDSFKFRSLSLARS